MKNFILLVTISLIIFTSCRKTEVFEDDLYTTVHYSPLITDNSNFKLEFKRGSVDPSVLGDDFIIGSISKFTIKATHLESHYAVWDEFYMEEGGTDKLSLNFVKIGQTLSEVSTESKIFLNTIDTDNDGIWWGTAVGSTNNIVNNTLRKLHPYITFKGQVEHNVTYTSIDNVVEFEMEPLQGRLNITIELEEELINDYYAKGILTFNKFKSDKNWFNKDNVNEIAYFSMSNKDCNNEANVALNVYIFRRNDDHLVNQWNLTSTEYPDKIGIQNGIDRWTNITISKETIKYATILYKFNFPWSEINNTIELK